MRSASAIGGIGCFAKSHTLHRMFRKVLHNFFMIKYEDIYPAAERILYDENGGRFFRAVIRSAIKRPDQIDRALELFSPAVTVNGFYLGLNEQSVQMMVFFKKAGCKPNKLILGLDNLTRLRINRLH